MKGGSGWYLLAGGPVALLCGHALAVGVNFSGGPATYVGCIVDDAAAMQAATLRAALTGKGVQTIESRTFFISTCMRSLLKATRVSKSAWAQS